MKEYELVSTAAMSRGQFGEDESQGHALSHDTATRRIQQQFVPIASAESARLRTVLRNSSDARHRAMAAQLLAYLPAKGTVVPDLTAATRDPSSAVRNAAMRGLWIIAIYAQKHPGEKIAVPYEPFMGMLHSLVWTDVNKSSLALMAISEQREPALLEALKKSEDALVDIARWAAPGHAMPGLVLLARSAGMSEKAIWDAVGSGDRAIILRGRE
jgi:hypothetical protein